MLELLDLLPGLRDLVVLVGLGVDIVGEGRLSHFPVLSRPAFERRTLDAQLFREVSNSYFAA